MLGQSNPDAVINSQSVWKRYTPSIVKASRTGFVMRASGKGEMAGDIWEIDEKGTVKEVATACPAAPSRQ
jgi:hypothetical protein